MVYTLLTLLLIFQIVDVYTTYCLVNLGADEANFIVLFLMNQFGDIIGLIVLKLFGMALLFLFVPMTWHKQWVRISIYSVNIFYLIVCSINISLLVYIAYQHTYNLLVYVF